ncbi:hypothetical protein BH11BAC6_BH11BAC6_18530 [soil metagenome]
MLLKAFTINNSLSRLTKFNKPISMTEVNCEIEGLFYKLKYLKKSTTEGEVIKGILFLNNAFGFSYTVSNDKAISFDPAFTNENRKKAIIKAVSESRRK